MSYYVVHCVLVEFPLLLTCILSVIASEYGRFIVLVRAYNVRAHIWDMNWSPSHFPPIKHYTPVTYVRTSMHTGKLGPYMLRKGLIKAIALVRAISSAFTGA